MTLSGVHSIRFYNSLLQTLGASHSRWQSKFGQRDRMGVVTGDGTRGTYVLTISRGSTQGGFSRVREDLRVRKVSGSSFTLRVGG